MEQKLAKCVDDMQVARECTEVLARASSTVPSWTRESNAYQRVVRSAPDYPAFG